MALPGIPPWTDQDLLLYHGTLQTNVASILQQVDVAKGKHLRDFGRGFYTTTSRSKAETWANDLAIVAGGQPAVIQFTVSRNALALLDILFFVRGDRNALDY